MASGQITAERRAAETARVSARNVSKVYRLGEHLRLASTLRRLLRRDPPSQGFEALDDVSFDVYPGECFGIVGDNGSGKSTVLQVLAGITTPSGGSMVVRGRVLPLLAVGAGFHIDLTGRENTVLFGTILGLERDVIDQRIDDIAAFAEVERHFDTPLKRYSSGMQSRLSFAIGMLFPADIYCFDEVLAVVDGEFRERCMAEIARLSSAGQSVLFISHDLDQIQQLCDRVLWMDRGRVHDLGSTTTVLEHYARHVHHD
jgi:ABC-type polysaccharide/polyol phosphate transport system ATPase subunit